MAGFHAFRSFRKNQKVWLAILGVGTMISFIILPVLMQLFSSGGGNAPGDIAQSRRFGKINQIALQRESDKRLYLGRFYKVLYKNLATDPNDQEQQVALYTLASMASQYDQQLDTEDMVNNWLLTQYARSKGMSIDQIDIVTHLQQLAGGYLTDSIYRQTLQDIGMSEQRLEYLISEQLLTTRIFESFGISLGAIPPSTRWEWFQRLNRQITAEVVAVPVDQFVGQVAEPTTAQLQVLFNENKTKQFDPMQADYGFIEPTKLAFQYVKATPNQKVLDSITDEEIKNYYEANKEAQFRKPVRPIGSPMLPNLPGQTPGNLFQPGGLGGFTPGDGTRAFPTPPRPRPTGGVKLTEDNPETPTTTAPDNVPKKEETPATEAAPTAEIKPAETPAAETPTEVVPATEEKPATTEEKKPEATEPEKKETSSINAVRTLFVSYRADEEPVKPESARPEVPKAEAQPDQPKAEEPKAEEAKAETVEEKTPKPEEPVDLSILYKPLDEVKEDIRQTLATEKVKKSVPLIEEKMRDYFQTYHIHSDREETPPPMPDLTEFAKGFDLELTTVPLGTIFESIKSDFAHGTTEREFLIRMFNETQILFEPKTTEDGNYVLWVTTIEEETKPEKLDEIKDKVLKRWKEIEARPLALKRAEELALEARTAGKSLADTFNGRSDVPVVETEPFTYKSYGASMYAAFFAMRGIPPRLGEVCEKGVAANDSEIDNKLIFAPGVDFMETASSLAIGETGVVFNQPQTVAYIIRVTGSTPSDDVLWERFQTADIREYRLAGQPEVVSEARTAWLNKIYEEVGFKWIRKPETIRPR